MALPSASPCGPITLPRLSLTFVLLCMLYLIHNVWVLPIPANVPAQGDHGWDPASVLPEVPVEEETKGVPQPIEDCLHAPGADRVLVVVKTGATEIYDKLPTQLLTLFRCTPYYIIFSDLAQTFSDYAIYDALNTVSENYKDNHEDFEHYRKLQQYRREGQDLSKLKGGKGWDLDRWKFMPMLHESYRMAPAEIDWFVFIEADTSLSWLNLLQYLNTMDPTQLIYTGAQNALETTKFVTTFAHGGSGIIISRAAVKKLEDYRDEVGAEKYDGKWESLTSATCCGDEIIARALSEVDVPMTPSWPRIQGETVSTIDWTEKHWCSPAITWHHVSPAQVDTMWKYQTRWIREKGWNEPYLYKDVFDDFVARHISVNRTAWNNLSRDAKFATPQHGNETSIAEFEELSDFEKRGIESFDNCADVCRAKDGCMQWMWAPGHCQLGKDIRLGDVDARGRDHWSSGWMLDRIDDMRAELEPCSVRWSDNH